MSSRSDARAAMAIPAILLFVVTCLAQLIASARGGTVLRGGSGSGSSGGGGHIDVDDVEGESSIDIIIESAAGDDGGGISVERRHRNKNRYNNNPASHNNHNNSDQEKEKKKDESFDFYVYSMSYQPEFCRENNERFAGCHDPRASWEGQLTIHGLWPSREDGTWPSTCTNEALDTTQLTDLSEDLSQKWPNIKALAETSPGHESFWSHEWSKHGTCSGLTQEEYFSSALNLLLPTPAIVEENYGSTIKRSSLEEGYSGLNNNGNEYSATLVCKYGYLSEVRVCYAKGEGGLVGDRMACPKTILAEDNCSDEIKIASFDNAVKALW